MQVPQTQKQQRCVHGVPLSHLCRDCENDVPEYPDYACPGCDRIMSRREFEEQRLCNDCVTPQSTGTPCNT